MAESLPPCPDAPFDGEGQPRFGTYRGRCETTELARESERLDEAAGRFLREKQWQSFAAADRRVAFGGTLLDATYASTLFVWLFDRVAGRMIADEVELLPPFSADIADDPAADDAAVVRGIQQQFRVTRDGPITRIDIDAGEIHGDLEFQTTETAPMTAICPVESEVDGGIVATEKQVCLPARGDVAAEGRTFEMSEDDALAFLDHTHGLLGRETEWHWAIAGGRLDDGTPIGFNLSSDFSTCRQNAVWLGDDLLRGPPVTFDFESATGRTTLDSDDAAIDLALSTEVVRRRKADLQVISSDYVQPIGSWHGRLIDRETHDLFGLAERHRARW